MVDFINEVEEELRKDQYNALLRKWGPWLIALAVLIVIGAGAFEYFKSSGERAASQTSITYFEAIERAGAQDTINAKNIYTAIADNARPGYAGLSLMQAASLSVENGDLAQAIIHYDQASQTFETDLHKQLAILKAGYLRADTGQYDDVQHRLTPLAQTGQPFEYLAKELLGFIKLENGDIAGARGEFSYLARSLDVPAGIKSRAEQVLTLETVQLSQPDTPLSLEDTLPSTPSLETDSVGEAIDTIKDAQP